MTIMWASAGRRYHSYRWCTALRRGQEQWDWDCPDDYCSHSHHSAPRAVRETTEADALARGLTPCRACLRGHPLPPSPDDFGHKRQWFNVGYCGGCPECGGREETLMCVRCGVEWPCATAFVLGIPNER